MSVMLAVIGVTASALLVYLLTILMRGDRQ